MARASAESPIRVLNISSHGYELGRSAHASRVLTFRHRAFLASAFCDTVHTRNAGNLAFATASLSNLNVVRQLKVEKIHPRAASVSARDLANFQQA
jgi:hypothetical protein